MKEEECSGMVFCSSPNTPQHKPDQVCDYYTTCSQNGCGMIVCSTPDQVCDY